MTDWESLLIFKGITFLPYMNQITTVRYSTKFLKIAIQTGRYVFRFERLNPFFIKISSLFNLELKNI